MNSAARKQPVPADLSESQEIKEILDEEDKKPSDSFRQGVKASLYSDWIKSLIRSGFRKAKAK